MKNIKSSVFKLRVDFLGILFLLLVSCKGSNEKIKIINPCNSNFSPKYIALAFEDGFDKDSIIVMFNNSVIFDSIVSTDRRLGLAEIIYITNNKNKSAIVILKINGQRFELKGICKQLVKLNYIQDTLIVEYLNHSKAYQ